MANGKRAISILSLCSILTFALASAGQAGEEERTKVIISGHVGLSGAILQGLPGDPQSDEQGFYTATMETGWSGTVTPVKRGYVFTPPAKTYTAVGSDLTNQNYRASVLTCKIFGNVGLPGVTLEGLPRSVVSDGNGNYAVDLPFGWSGTVTPTRQGYTFDPMSRMYSNIEAGQSRDDYTPCEIRYTISGNVGVPGVTLQGFPGNPQTDENGVYCAEVPYGWAGVASPAKTGYAFQPETRAYSHVQRNHGNEDYAATMQMLTISDVVTFGDQPVPGVSVIVDPGEDQALTDSTGRYAVRVPYGWTGRLILSHPRYVINPSVLPYSNLTTHIVDGKQTPASQIPSISPASPSAVRPQASLAGDTSAVVVIPTSAVDPTTLAQVKEDLGIMLQILRDKLSEPRTILGTLYDFGDFFDSSGGTEALYLQGYGAVFVMEVSFPLTPATPQADSEPQPAGDPIWQRARQRMYTSPGPAERRRGTPVLSDPESFEQFKTDMIGMLKHAANIRHLPAEESVVLTIISQASQSADAFGRTSRSSYGGASYGGGFVVGGMFSSRSSFSSSGQTSTYGRTGENSSGYGVTGDRTGYGAASAPSTVLTLRAVKADIDAFAQGDITSEQFCTKVKTFSY